MLDALVGLGLLILVAAIVTVAGRLAFSVLGFFGTAPIEDNHLGDDFMMGILLIIILFLLGVAGVALSLIGQAAFTLFTNL